MTHAPDNRLGRHDWFMATGIFVLALMVRLIFLATSPDAAWPHSFLFEGDAPRWVEWARALDRGEPYQRDLPLFSPAVTYVLHWLGPWSSPNPMVPMKALWCAATAAACSLAYLATALTVNRRIALIAAGLLTFSFGTYVLSTSLNNEALYLPVLMLTVLATVPMVRRPGIMPATIFGGLHGIAMLIRPEHALLFVMMLIYVPWRLVPVRGITWKLHLLCKSDWRPLTNTAAALAVAVLTSLLVCAPWSVRSSLALQYMNYESQEPLEYDAAPVRWTDDARQFVDALPAFARLGTFQTMNFLAAHSGADTVTQDDLISYFVHTWNYIPEPLPNWTFISIKGGMDFLLANHPAAHEGYSEAPLRLREGEGSTFLDRPDLLRLLNHGYAIGWGHIRGDVPGWLGRVGAKLSRFFDGVALGFTSRNLPLGWHGQRRQVDMFTATGGDGPTGWLFYDAWRLLMLIAIIAGAALAVSRKVGGIWLLIIAYKLIVTILFYGYARQAASILPAFFVLLAISADYAAMRLAPTFAPLRRWMKPVAILLLLAALALDVSGSIRRPSLNVIGEVKPMPELGEDAFSSHHRLVIRPE